MPRHPKHRHAGRRSAPRSPRAAADLDPVARLRPLIHEGIITAAALEANDDLAAAAASMHRLGSLTSGMWRALSRELVTASERLDRQVEERLEDLQRRSLALQVDAGTVLAAGAAASHLEEHRETLDTLLPGLEEAAVRRLAAPDVLFGFAVDNPMLPFEDDDLDDDEVEQDEVEEDGADAADASEDADMVSPLTLRIWLFLWPAPLSPARVAIVLPVLADPTATKPDLSMSMKVAAGHSLIDALALTLGLPSERIPPMLSALAMICLTAHQIDERDDEDEDEDDDEDDED
jgi:hypothetical protein